MSLLGFHFRVLPWLLALTSLRSGLWAETNPLPTGLPLVSSNSSSSRNEAEQTPRLPAIPLEALSPPRWDLKLVLKGACETTDCCSQQKGKRRSKDGLYGHQWVFPSAQLHLHTGYIWICHRGMFRDLVTRRNGPPRYLHPWHGQIHPWRWSIPTFLVHGFARPHATQVEIKLFVIDPDLSLSFTLWSLS